MQMPHEGRTETALGRANRAWRQQLPEGPGLCEAEGTLFCDGQGWREGDPEYSDSKGR